MHLHENVTSCYLGFSEGGICVFLLPTASDNNQQVNHCLLPPEVSNITLPVML